VKMTRGDVPDSRPMVTDGLSRGMTRSWETLSSSPSTRRVYARTRFGVSETDIAVYPMPERVFSSNYNGSLEY
jgi:hypothetical protein